MGKIQRFEELEIWQNAADLAVEIYNVTSGDKLKYDWGFKDQLQRASMSVSNNIAEGFEYNSNRQFVRFLRIAKASCGEVRSQVSIALRIGLVSKEIYDSLYEKLMLLSRKLSSFIKYLVQFEKNKNLKTL